MSIIKTIKENDPVAKINQKENIHNFLSFCSFVCLIKNKKMNLPNIFLVMLDDPFFMDMYKNICEIDTDYDACRRFLEYDPLLYKSKYIRNYLDKKKPTLS